RAAREGGRRGGAQARDSSRVRARARLSWPRRCAPGRGDREAEPRRHRSARRGPGRGGGVKLIYEKSVPGRTGYMLPRYVVPRAAVPDDLRRAEPPRLPELAEPEVLRHFTELSTRNFGIDTGF